MTYTPSELKASELKAIGVDISDHFLVHLALSSLPNQFENPSYM